MGARSQLPCQHHQLRCRVLFGVLVGREPVPISARYALGVTTATAQTSGAEQAALAGQQQGGNVHGVRQLALLDE